MLRDESENARQRRDERPRQIGVGCVSDDYKQRHIVLNDGRELVRLVSDSPVMCHGDPAAGCDISQPFVVRAIRREMIGVSLYAKSGVAQDGWELQAEIAIGKEDNTQATRSYRTALSISARLSS